MQPLESIARNLVFILSPRGVAERFLSKGSNTTRFTFSEDYLGTVWKTGEKGVGVVIGDN